MESDFGRSLSIASLGPCTVDRPKPASLPYTTRPINQTRDIEGATFVNKHEAFARESLFLRSDIEGSKSKKLIHGRNTRDNTLYVDDIEGTRYVVKDKMMFTRRVVDPLQPEYELPSCQMAPVVEPKFIRDHINVDDIEGTKSKPMYPFKMRDSYTIGDIEGTQCHWKPRHARVLRETTPREIMKVQDDALKMRFASRTTRSVDPMDPKYVIFGTEHCDDLRYSKPKQLKPYIPENNLLKTADIPYATTTYKEQIKPLREIRNIMHVGDIAGAQADTMRLGISTNRSLNPLVPLYPSLDGYGEVLEPIMRPLVPAAIISMPTLPLQRMAKETLGEEAGSSSSFNYFDTSRSRGMGEKPILPGQRTIYNNNNKTLPELNFEATAGGGVGMDRSSPATSSRQQMRPSQSMAALGLSNSARLAHSVSTSALGSGRGKLSMVEGRAQKEKRAEIEAVRALE